MQLCKARYMKQVTGEGEYISEGEAIHITGFIILKEVSQSHWSMTTADQQMKNLSLQEVVLSSEERHDVNTQHHKLDAVNIWLA